MSAEPDADRPVGSAVEQAPSRLRYDLLYRGGVCSWWRALLGVALVGAGTFVFGPILLMVPLMLILLVRGDFSADKVESILGLTPPTPLGLAWLNLSLAIAIPVAILAVLALHRLRPGWLISVAGRMRWGYLGACLGASLLAMLATIAVGLMLPESAAGMPTGGLNDFTTTTRDYLIVVLLLTPFQAAGEEFAFRGYLTQAVGGVTGSRILSVFVPALLFALMHGAQEPPIFVDRFAFGIVAGVLVLATGGLEAGIALHVVNNLFAFGLALAFGDMESALNPSGSTWWTLPTTLTQSLVYLALAWWLAKRMGVATTAEMWREVTPWGAERPVLVPSGSRV